METNGNETSWSIQKLKPIIHIISSTSFDLFLLPHRRNPNNDRNTKGGRGPRRARDGKRTFDRRSGTGRGKEIKKDGGGSHNWGSDKNEAKKAEGHVDEFKNEVEESDNNQNANKDEAATETATATATAPALQEEEEQVEVEEQTLSLEEYLSAKQEVTLFQPKGAKQVEDEFHGKKSYAYQEENFLVIGTGKALRKKGTGKEKGTAEKLDVDFKIKRSAGDDDNGGSGNDRRRGDGGGRRNNDRRRPGRGDKRRPGRGGGFALDANAFPSL